MKVLMSIKPEFANQIFDGYKKYEYRRSIFKDKSVKTILVYSSLPVQRVIGEFEIVTILHRDLDSLWNKTKYFAGITEEYFYKYFEGKSKGYAIRIGSTTLYKEPLSLEVFGIHPPQSFVYLKGW